MAAPPAEESAKEQSRHKKDCDKHSARADGASNEDGWHAVKVDCPKALVTQFVVEEKMGNDQAVNNREPNQTTILTEESHAASHAPAATQDITVR